MRLLLLTVAEESWREGSAGAGGVLQPKEKKSY